MAPGERSRRPRRQPRAWLVRGALAIAIAAAGFSGVTASLSEVAKRVDPSRAHQLDRDNGIVAAALAESAFVAQPDSSPVGDAARLARDALVAEPTAVNALTVLAFQAELRGDEAARDRIFRYATALSRRELKSQVWAIEEAVTRGDIAGALRVYDLALRTSGEARGLLFPVLTAALAEPRVRSELIKVLAGTPTWTTPFVVYATGNSPDPAATVQFLEDARSIGLPVTAEMQSGLVNALVARQQFDEAWSYYASFRRGVRRDRSRDSDFALEVDARAAFDWVPGTDPGISSAILPSQQGGVLDFSLSPGASGVIVRQTQLLPPGSYTLSGRSSGVGATGQSRPFWTLTCADGRELGRVSLSNSSSSRADFAGRFTIPQGCAVQTLMLVGRSSNEMSGVSGQIERAVIVPSA